MNKIIFKSSWKERLGLRLGWLRSATTPCSKSKTQLTNLLTFISGDGGQKNNKYTSQEEVPFVSHHRSNDPGAPVQLQGSV